MAEKGRGIDCKHRSLSDDSVSTLIGLDYLYECFDVGNWDRDNTPKALCCLVNHTPESNVWRHV